MEVKFIAKAAEKLVPLASWGAKNSPAIFTGVGITSLVASNVFSSWAAIKSKKVLEEKIDERLDDEDQKRAAIAKMAKVAGYYTPTLITTGLGIGFVVHGHNIQQVRLAGAIAAYSTLSTAFTNYRARVIEDQGPSSDIRYYYGEETKSANIYVEQEEGKKPKKQKEDVVIRSKMAGSPYATIFDEISPDWQNNREQNLYFLKCQQVAANHKLRSRGYLFLSEVLEMLGLPYNQAGQFVGWIDEAYEGSVDGIVDFGISSAYLEEELDAAQAEGRNPEPSIWLDFNVDGEIWDKIPLVKKIMR